MCSSHNFPGHCGGNTFFQIFFHSKSLISTCKMVICTCKWSSSNWLVFHFIWKTLLGARPKPHGKVACKPVVYKCKLMVYKCAVYIVNWQWAVYIVNWQFTSVWFTSVNWWFSSLQFTSVNWWFTSVGLEV